MPVFDDIVFLDYTNMRGRGWRRSPTFAMFRLIQMYKLTLLRVMFLYILYK